MFNYAELRAQSKRERHILGLLPSNVDEKQLFSAKVLLTSMALATVLFIGGCINSRPAQAEVTDSQAVQILVGEASNQGLKGMICVAEVLRTRNSVKGFYGLKAKHSHKEPEWVWAQARKAWEMSASTNYTRKANHFENIQAFGCPSWVKNCVETFRYKDHVFFKEMRA